MDLSLSLTKELYPGGPRVKPLTLGMGRFNFSLPQCGPALHGALEGGLRVFDTSPHYQRGESQTLLAQVLEDWVKKQSLEINQNKNPMQNAEKTPPCIFSKGGLGQYPQDFREGIEFFNLDAESFYSLDRLFLKQQIDTTLKRLNMGKIGVFFIENPEYLITILQEGLGLSIEQSQLKLKQMLTTTFAFLEDQIAEGTLEAYGVSCATFAVDPSLPQHIPLELCLEAAQNCSPNHHLKMIQLPCNWIESEAVLFPPEEPVLAMAHRYGLGVAISRPFNATYEKRLYRLTDVTVPYPADPALVPFWQEWQTLARDLKQFFRESLPLPGYEGASLAQMVLATWIHHPWVSTVVVGLRTPAQVTEALESLKLPKLPHIPSLLQNIYDHLEFDNGENHGYAPIETKSNLFSFS